MNIKKTVGPFIAAVVLVVAGFLVPASAGVSVNIGINAPVPVYTMPAPPSVAFIPGTYVYFVPGIELDILFYHGYWYRPYEGRWYRSRGYNGPWGYLEHSRVPRPLIELPPNYRHVPPGRQHIPYGHLKKNWGRWERERYWDRHDDWREDRREDRRDYRREERREHREDRREHRREEREERYRR